MRHSPLLPQLNVVIVGHVDHGKSTLIGRLLHDSGSLSEEKLDELKRVCQRRGVELEWSFVLDALQAERDQAVTIDTTQIWFRSPQRRYVIVDAPGHLQFLRNMLSGAAQADAAVLVVDATEGMREQSRRHAYLLRLLGLRQIVVAVNKMDTISNRTARFEAVRDEASGYLRQLGIEPAAVVPVSARDGDNLLTPSARMGWYRGPTLIEALDGLTVRAPSADRPLRLPIQDVYRFDARRILVGRVEGGVLGVGDEILFSPSDRRARVRSIETWDAGSAPLTAGAGQVVGFTLDEPLFVERGEMVSHAADPPKLSSVFRANLFWLDEAPRVPGAQLTLKLGTDSASVVVQSIEKVVDPQTLAGQPAGAVECNEVAEIVLRAPKLMALDAYRDNPSTGRFVLVDGFDTVGGGVLSMDGYPDQRALGRVMSANLTQVEHLLTPQARAWRNGHQGAVIWMTGLSGAGKSTLAMRLEQRLFNLGFHVYVLDGDNIRHGVNADLGFAPRHRAENIRRVGEIAALFADAGFIVVTAFISPYQADRDRARFAAGAAFHEVHVQADLETCEARDPKGLYRRARAGEIAEFTGVTAPYEAPLDPELAIDTTDRGVDACVDELVEYLQRSTALQPVDARDVA